MALGVVQVGVGGFHRGKPLVSGVGHDEDDAAGAVLLLEGNKLDIAQKKLKKDDVDQLYVC